MRRLIEAQPADTAADDRGVATIFIILALTAVLIGAALSIDVGRYVFEARSAQNSADATALAVATDCALGGSPIDDYTPYRKDDQTTSAPACGNNEATITVTASVDQTFLQQSIGDVSRSATAKWGTLGTATTLPIVVADCEVGPVGTTVVIYLDDPKPQTGCSSLAGGFSQLLGDGCEVTFSAGDYAPGKTGGDLQKDVPCITNPDPAELPLPYHVYVPVYDAQECAELDCKGKGPYLITGFAYLLIDSYSFNGSAYYGDLGKKCPDADRGRYCIQGHYEKFVTSRGTPGPSEDFGVSLVYLSD